MNNHRYILEPYKGLNTRHHCPGCQQKDKTFSLYIDTETGQHVHPTVGRCNRETKCGYHLTPKEYFQDNDISIDTYSRTHPAPLQQKPPSYISIDTMKGSLKGYDQNNFVRWLVSFFGEEVTNDILQMYFIGTLKHWSGSTVFWQVDKIGRIRTGKIILYNETTGKRIKKCTTWVHSILKLIDFELKQCLFGEHLLKDVSKPVAIVESEKTAIIANIYLPRFIWLATGGLSSLTVEKCKVLSGRNVVLFPDVKGFDKWNEKMKEISKQMPGTRFNISDLLETNATDEEREQGCDIADYLIKFDWKLFKEKPTDREPIPERDEETEKMFARIKRMAEIPHLFPNMKNTAIYIDAIPF